jgi:phosphate/sulfate permease
VTEADDMIILMTTKMLSGGMRWIVVGQIVWAWIFTLLASGLIGYALERAAATL